jgi:hypothetical protein
VSLAEVAERIGDVGELVTAVDDGVTVPAASSSPRATRSALFTCARKNVTLWPLPSDAARIPSM